VQKSRTIMQSVTLNACGRRCCCEKDPATRQTKANAKANTLYKACMSSLHETKCGLSNGNTPQKAVHTMATTLPRTRPAGTNSPSCCADYMHCCYVHCIRGTSSNGTLITFLNLKCGLGLERKLLLDQQGCSASMLLFTWPL